MSSNSSHIDVTAFHEAGHVIATLAEGDRVAFVRVSRHEPGAGVTRVLNKDRKNPFACGQGALASAWHYVLESRLKLVRPILAGPLAEAKRLGAPLRTLGSVNDLERCLLKIEELQSHYDFLSGLGGKLPAFCPYAVLNNERSRVRRWVAQPKVWTCIRHLAEALMRQEHLDENEILQVCSAAPHFKDQHQGSLFQALPEITYAENFSAEAPKVREWAPIWILPKKKQVWPLAAWTLPRGVTRVAA